MFITIDISAKRYLTLQIFIKNFFNNALKHKLTIIESQHKKLTKKTKFSVLKSPHVNKTAQEQFEYRIYRTKLKCFVPQMFLFLIFLKKLKFNLFSDIDFKITILRNTNTLNTLTLNRFNVNNYMIDFKELKLINYFQLLENFGKIHLKTKN